MYIYTKSDLMSENTTEYDVTTISSLYNMNANVECRMEGNIHIFISYNSRNAQFIHSFLFLLLLLQKMECEFFSADFCIYRETNIKQRESCNLGRSINYRNKYSTRNNY